MLIRNGAYLNDPETVKETIAVQENWSTTTKSNVTLAYKSFADFLGVKWNPPRYKHSNKLPFIPLESEIDTLICGAGKKTATRLQLLKETGMRIGEAAALRFTDIDSERCTVTVNNPEKNGNPRIFKVSSKLVAMLNKMPRDQMHVFNGNPKSWRITLNKTRQRLAAKLHNPRLLQIHFHTLRHWKATTEYHKTRDIYYVKNLLGHKRIQNTEKYITIEHAIFDESHDKFHSATARTVEEAAQLIETGFEYVCTHNDIMLFRKRK